MTKAYTSAGSLLLHERVSTTTHSSTMSVLSMKCLDRGFLHVMESLVVQNWTACCKRKSFISDPSRFICSQRYLALSEPVTQSLALSQQNAARNG
jgi:hypothetical protein